MHNQRRDEVGARDGTGNTPPSWGGITKICTRVTDFSTTVGFTTVWELPPQTD
jgi:hypothetical protein